MTAKVTVELPEELIQQIRTVAGRTQRSFDEVLAEWLRLAGSEPALEVLGDEELLAVCDSQPETSFQELLSALLERNQEGALDETERRGWTR